MPKLIKQKGTSDCTIACLAMFTGRSYDEVRAAGIETGEFHPKKGTISASRILIRLGYHQENLGNSEDNDALKDRNRGVFRSIMMWDRWTSANVFVDLCWGRPALVSVKSLNNLPHGMHSVYYDGEKVYDPQNGRRGKKFYEAWEDGLPIDRIHIWRHPGPK